MHRKTANTHKIHSFTDDKLEKCAIDNSAKILLYTGT